MKSQGDLPLNGHIASRSAILVLSCVAGLAIFGLAIFLRVAYDGWMHRNGSLHVVGSVLTAVVVAYLVARKQLENRRRRLEMLHRFETIKWMNDRIRNALQAIECVTYAAAPEATEAVRSSVDSIETVLQEVLAGAHPAALPSQAEKSKRSDQVASIR